MLLTPSSCSLLFFSFLFIFFSFFKKGGATERGTPREKHCTFCPPHDRFLSYYCTLHDAFDASDSSGQAYLTGPPRCWSPTKGEQATLKTFFRVFDQSFENRSFVGPSPESVVELWPLSEAHWHCGKNKNFRCNVMWGVVCMRTFRVRILVKQNNGESWIAVDDTTFFFLFLLLSLSLSSWKNRLIFSQPTFSRDCTAAYPLPTDTSGHIPAMSLLVCAVLCLSFLPVLASTNSTHDKELLQAIKERDVKLVAHFTFDGNSTTSFPDHAGGLAAQADPTRCTRLDLLGNKSAFAIQLMGGCSF